VRRARRPSARRVGSAGALIAGKACNARERVVESLEKVGVEAVIPSRSNAMAPRPFDRHLYKRRHLIENFFGRLRQYRAIATRYGKRAAAFLGAIYLATTVVRLSWRHALGRRLRR